MKPLEGEVRAVAPQAGRSHYFRQMLLLAIALMFITGLYLQSRSVPMAVHHGYTMLLQEVREAGALLNMEILSNHIAVSRNYDQLNSKLQRVESLLNALLPPPAYLNKERQQEIARQHSLLKASFLEKAARIERFKRSSTVLRNSSTYFFASSARFLRLPRDGELRVTLERYIRQMLYFAESPDAAREAHAKTTAAVLRQLALEPSERALVDNLLVHGQLILENARQVNVDIQEVMAINSGVLLNVLGQIYVAGYEDSVRAAGRYQTLAYVLSGLLLAYLAFVFVRLERARLALSHSNHELQQRQAAQERAESLLRLHDAAFLNAHEGMTLTDLNGTIIDVNPAFTRITGYARSEAIGRNPRVLKSGRHDQNFYMAMWKSIQETGNWRGEIWNRGKFGDVYPELLSISAVCGDDGVVTNYVAVFSDISRIKEQEKQLTEMAYYDALTGLPNRVLLADRIAHAMPLTRRNQNMMAICYLDLDGFKPINDTWGHDIGDLVLISMAERFQACLRGGDTVARLGGDEFVLLLVNLNAISECEAAVVRILAAVAEPLLVTPQPVSLSASIGVSLYPQDDSDADALMRHADQAMYRAKQSGKNGFHLFDPVLDTALQQKNNHVEQVRAAFAAGQFLLHYQPQVELRSGKVQGVEALIRWQHPDTGLLLPGRFLPMIESDPLMLEITHWVIEQALQQVQCWQAQGMDLGVSVNIPGVALQHPDFVQDLGELLSRYPEGRHQLKMEVLETTALTDLVRVSRVIEECRDMGICFVLDDFGTGYSSLTYLKRLPVTTVKIDQSFVSELLIDANNLSIVQAVLWLSRAFQREVVAEGIESVAQGRLLLQIGCRLGQGYAIARPMPPEELPAWVASWQPYPEWQDVGEIALNDTAMSLLAAKIAHSNWLDQLLFSVRNHNMVMHQHVADPQYCAFGQWYARQQDMRFLSLPAFARAGVLHRDIHDMAHRIDDLLRDGLVESAKALLPEIVTLHEQFMNVLDGMEDQVFVGAL